MKRYEAVILALSLVMGFLGTCLFSGYVSEPPKPVRMEQAAWWGGLYPQFGAAGAVEKRETEVLHGCSDEPKREIRFRYLTFLNELGGTDE